MRTRSHGEHVLESCLRERWIERIHMMCDRELKENEVKKFQM